MKIKDLLEGKNEDSWTKDGVEMCSKKCCGQPVTECKCGPSCKHCSCYEKNKSMNEMTSSGSVASVAIPMSGVIKRSKNGAPEAFQKKNKDGTVMNALDMPNNIMGHKTNKR
jgi:hypothetical protein